MRYLGKTDGALRKTSKLNRCEAPVRISFRCPRCGGPHHVERCEGLRLDSLIAIG